MALPPISSAPYQRVLMIGPQSLPAPFSEGIFSRKVAQLREEAERNYSIGKPSVVILGAGPAGLLRAIESIKNGNPTLVIERNPETRIGRENAVHLEHETIELLKEKGVYDYLLMNGSIFPEQNMEGLNVKIGDLEQALKALLNVIGGPDRILYGRQVESLGEDADHKIALHLQDRQGRVALLDRKVDVLVVAEGAHSRTAQLLGINRIQKLSKIPVIAAIFKDNHPKIVDAASFFSYTRISLINTGTYLYYLSCFIGKFLFQGEYPSNPRRDVAGAVILQTPGQNYVGYGLNKERSQKLEGLTAQIKDFKERISQAQTAGAPLDPRVEQDLTVAEKELKDELIYWAYISFFSANFARFLQNFYGKSSPQASFLPLAKESLSLVQIGVDQAETLSGSRGGSQFLLCGDSVTTFDPTTGLGCNAALRTAEHFTKFLKNLESTRLTANRIASYHEGYSLDHRLWTHRAIFLSSNLRHMFRPDAAGIL